jgi:hypothetical protein
VIWTWCARVAWVALPIATGVAFADAMDGWSHASSTVAIVLLWLGWLAGAIALFGPRPWGFAILRVVAPTAVVVNGIANVPGSTKAIAVACSVVAMALVLGGPVARMCANSISYGDEDRYPLSVPLTISGAPLPIAVFLIATGVSVGPLLLADGRIALGLVATVIGYPVAAIASNSVRALSQRWLIFVPAGLVVLDPLTLADPVLMPREDVEGLTAAEVPGALDLRLGPARGTVTLLLHEHTLLTRRRGRADGVALHVKSLRIAIVERRVALSVAERRRIRVTDAQAAVPPPSTTSPS